MMAMISFDLYKDTIWLDSMKKQHLTKVENRIQQIFDKTMRAEGSDEENWQKFQKTLETIVLADNVEIRVYDEKGKGQKDDIEDNVLNALHQGKKEVFIKKDQDEVQYYHLYETLHKGEKPMGIINIYEKSEKIMLLTNIKMLLKQYLLAMIIMLILSGYVAWFISRALMNRVNILAHQLPKTNIEYLDTPLDYKEEDEITPLITSYNNMLRRLKQQTERLIQIEREESWREMAKQIVHEISNPLTPLKLLVQNFQRKYNPNDTDNVEKVNKLVETIVHQVDVIHRVTQSFSEYSKAPLGNNAVDLVKILKYSLEIFPAKIVSFSTNQEELYHRIDETYFTRIITNIVKNAIQSIPHQNKKVEVKLQDDHQKILISIKDNGNGIPKEYQDKIFDKQFTTKSSGMGVGLSIVKKIVEDYNGKIWFETEEGVGTTFYVEFYK